MAPAFLEGRSVRDRQRVALVRRGRNPRNPRRAPAPDPARRARHRALAEPATSPAISSPRLSGAPGGGGCAPSRWATSGRLTPAARRPDGPGSRRARGRGAPGRVLGVEGFRAAGRRNDRSTATASGRPHGVLASPVEVEPSRARRDHPGTPDAERRSAAIRSAAGGAAMAFIDDDRPKPPPRHEIGQDLALLSVSRARRAHRTAQSRDRPHRRGQGSRGPASLRRGRPVPLIFSAARRARRGAPSGRAATATRSSP